MPFWEDTEPRLSPDGTTRRLRRPRARVGGRRRPAARRGSSVEAGSPVWLGNDRLVVSVERDDTSRLAVLDVADPWPRPLCGSEPQGSDAAAGSLERYGDEWGAAVSPDGTTVAFVFTPGTTSSGARSGLPTSRRARPGR